MAAVAKAEDSRAESGMEDRCANGTRAKIVARGICGNVRSDVRRDIRRDIRSENIRRDIRRSIRTDGYLIFICSRYKRAHATRSYSAQKIFIEIIAAKILVARCSQRYS